MMTFPTHPEHLDTSVLADIRALGTDGEDVLAEVASLFFADVPGQLLALTAAIDAGDVGQTSRIAHCLKGAALSIGAWQMARIGAMVEHAARGQALDRAAAHAVELFTEFESTRLALEQEVRS